jgi:lipopolysaccharide export system permease protein
MTLLILGFLFTFVERWDDFLEAQVPTFTSLNYLILMLPQYVVYILPVSILLSTFITLGLLGRSNELTAIKASGISGYYLARLFLVVAGFLSAFSFLWAETMVPWANRKAAMIWQTQVGKTPQSVFLARNEIWFRMPSSGGMTLYHIGFLKIPETSLGAPHLQRWSAGAPPVMKNVTVMKTNRRFELLERIDAKEMRWDGQQWIFLEGMRWDADTSGTSRVEPFEKATIPLPEKPEDFQWITRDVEEMGFFELRRYTQRARDEGYDVTVHLTDLHFKVASTFFCVVVVLFTIPLALRIPPHAGGLALGVAVSMGIGALYYLVMATGLALGRSGGLPPFLGAWGGNILFGMAGGFWMLHLRH